MKVEGVSSKNKQLQEQSRVSIVEAYRESPRAQKTIILIVLAYILVTAIGFIVLWAMHEIPLKPGAVAFVMLSMLVILIWHSVVVKGVRQTVAFFLLSWAILIAAASATLVCAWDLMVDPFATSRVWTYAAHKRRGGIG